MGVCGRGLLCGHEHLCHPTPKTSVFGAQQQRQDLVLLSVGVVGDRSAKFLEEAPEVGAGRVEVFKLTKHVDPL
jgi:hypothetical protein